MAVTTYLLSELPNTAHGRSWHGMFIGSPQNGQAALHFLQKHSFCLIIALKQTENAWWCMCSATCLTSMVTGVMVVIPTPNK